MPESTENTATIDPPKKKLSVQDFATRIKAKYPAYKNLDDTLLTSKILEKYPVYKTQVDFTPPAPQQVPQSNGIPKYDLNFQMPSQAIESTGRPAIPIPEPINKEKEFQKHISNSSRAAAKISDIVNQRGDAFARNQIAADLVTKRFDDRFQIKSDNTSVVNMIPNEVLQEEKNKVWNSIAPEQVAENLSGKGTQQKIVQSQIKQLRKDGKDKDANELTADLYLANSDDVTPDNAHKVNDNVKKIKKGELDFVDGKLIKPTGSLESIEHGYKERTKVYDLGYNLLTHSDEDNIQTLNKELSQVLGKHDAIPTTSGVLGAAGEFIGAEGISTAKGVIPSLTGIGAALGMALTAEEMGVRGFSQKMLETYAQQRSEIAEKNPSLSQEEVDKQAYGIALKSAKAAGLMDAAFGALLARGRGKLPKSARVWSATAEEAAKSIPKQSISTFKKLVQGSKEFLGEGIKTGVPITGAAGVTQAGKNLVDIGLGIDKKWDEGVAESMKGMLLLHMMFHSARAVGKMTKEGAKSLYQAFAKMNPEDVQRIGNNLVEDRILSRHEADGIISDIEAHRLQDLQIPAHITDTDQRLKIHEKIEEHNKLKAQLKGEGGGGLHEAYAGTVKDKLKKVEDDIHILSQTPEEQVRMLTNKAKELERQLTEDKVARQEGGKPKLEDRELVKRDLADVNKSLKEVTEKVNSEDYKAGKVIEPHLDKIPGMLQDMAKQEPEQFLKFIADQAQGVSENGEVVSGGDTRYALKEMGIPDKLVDQAIEMFPAPKVEEVMAEPPKESGGSVIRPEEMPKNETITIAPKEESVQSNPLADVESTTKGIAKLNSDEISQLGKIVTRRSEYDNPDMELTRKDKNNFLVELIAENGEYAQTHDVVTRIKDHTPNWSNFTEDVENGAKKIVNVTVGDFNNSDARRSKTELEEFKKRYPDVQIIDVHIAEGETLKEAQKKIDDAINSIADMPKSIAEAYHTEKSGGTLGKRPNPKLVKAVEEAIGKKENISEPINTEQPIDGTVGGEPPIEPPKTESAPGSEDVGTNIKHKTLEEDAADKGLKELADHTTVSFEDLRTKADNLIKEGATSDIIKRALNDEGINSAEKAVLVKAKATIDKELEISSNELAEANLSGDQARIDEISAKNEMLRNQAYEIYSAAKKAGSKAGLDLATQKLNVTSEYSLGEMLNRKREAAGGEPLTKEQSAKIEIQSKEITAKEKKIKEKGKELADKIRALRINKGDRAQANIFGIPVAIYDGAVVTIANAVEQGANLADAIKRGIDYVKENGGFKDAKEERKFSDHIKYGGMQEGRLAAYKKRTQAAIEKIKSKISNKQFEKEEVPPIELDKEALDLRAELADTKHKFDLEVLKDEMDKRSWTEKHISTNLRKTIGTVKAITSGIDDSAVMIQNYLSILANPKMGASALKEHALDALSQKRFDRQLAALHNSPYWELIKDSGVEVLEPTSLNEALKEELMANSFHNEKINIKIKGKDRNVNPAQVLKPFERAFTSLGNNLRVKMFLQQAEKLLDEGKTFKTHPEEFKALARVVNSTTGRGKQNKYVELANPVVTAFIWSPKLLSSGFDALGITDLVSLVPGAKRLGTEGYYRKLTPRQRKYALMQVGKGLGVGISVMAAAGLAKKMGADLDVDYDPRSVTFGNISSGNKSVNVFGRFSSIAKVLVQSVTGERVKGEKVEDLNSGKYGKKNVGGVVGSFARGKMTPIGGLTWDYVMNSKRHFFTGEEMTMLNSFKQLAPISLQGLATGLERDGSLYLLNDFLPNFVGVKVSDQRDFKKKSKGGATGSHGRPREPKAPRAPRRPE